MSGDALDRIRGVREVGPPWSVRGANPETPDDGGTLDRGIVGHLEDGTPVVIGEVWAAGVAGDGRRVSLDSRGLARDVCRGLLVLRTFGVAEALEDAQAGLELAIRQVESGEDEPWVGSTPRKALESVRWARVSLATFAETEPAHALLRRVYEKIKAGESPAWSDVSGLYQMALAHPANRRGGGQRVDGLMRNAIEREQDALDLAEAVVLHDDALRGEVDDTDRDALYHDMVKRARDLLEAER